MSWDEIGQQQTEDRGRGQSLAAQCSFPAGWLTAQGGDSALPQCQSGLAAAALPTCVKTKQKNANACTPHSLPPPPGPPLVPPRKAPAFIPHPVSYLTVATFLFHLFAPVLMSASSLEAWERRANLNFSRSTDLLAKTFSLVCFQKHAASCFSVQGWAHKERLLKAVIRESKDSKINKSKYQVAHLGFLTVAATLTALIIVLIGMFRSLPLKRIF